MRRWLHFVVPGIVLVLGVGLRFADPPQLADARLRIFDIFQEIKPRPYTPSPVRVVDLDDASLARYGQWPWPRTLVARLVDRLGDAGAAVIAFDIVFSEPDRTSPGRIVDLWPETPETDRIRSEIETLPDHDDVLAAAMARARVVTGFVLTRGDEGAAPAVKAGFARAGDDPLLFMPAYSGTVVNLPVLEAAAVGNGLFNFDPDRDQIVRRVPLFASLKGQIYPTLVAEALRVAQGASSYVIKASGASGEEAFGVPTGITDVKIGGFVVPTDKNGQVWLYHTRPPVAERTIPAWRVLSDDFDPLEAQGMIVFVGTSAAGLVDLRATPLHPAMPGVEMHAQAVEQIIGQIFLERPDWADGAELFYVALLGVLVVLVVARVGAAWGAAFSASWIVAALGASWYAFDTHGFLFAPLYPSVVVLLVYLSASITSYLRTDAERREVRNAFSRYMSPALVERLARNPGTLRLGGETKPMTILFSDIRGFTSISERFRGDPEGLTRLINRHFSAMTDRILEHSGTIDKYMGDAVMAFWNAPLDDEHHARNACMTALGMLDGLAGLNAELKSEAEAGGEPCEPIVIGVGVNTGVCLVGNMGSRHRFSYSVIGDDVNLAARLEGQCKTYGVPIVIGENTLAEADGFAALELDLVRVRGKDEATRIYTLLGPQAVRESGAFAALEAEHRALLEAFRGQDWQGARRHLALCRELSGEYGLARLYDAYQARIAGFEREPPGPGWDGVFDAETK